MGAVDQAAIPYARPKQHGEIHAAAWTALATALLIAIAAILGMTVSSAFLFVSAGPIIYEYIERPLARASSPRSTLLGNGVALIVGYSSLAAFGLLHEPSTVQQGVTLARFCAVIVAIAVTGGLLFVMHAVHPPAGSTLLLVTLGILRAPVDLACVFASIVVISAVAFVLNRSAGIPVPVWSSQRPPPIHELEQAHRDSP